MLKIINLLLVCSLLQPTAITTERLIWNIPSAASLNFILENWTYAIIPLISGLVGWVTNVIALRMTFYPLKFKGIPPYLGWQGIIPSKAGIMAGKAVDLITGNLVRIEDQFQRIDVNRFIEEMAPELERVSIKIVDEIMEIQAPAIWKRLPENIKEQVYQRVSEELPVTVEVIMNEIKSNINQFFDLKAMVIATLTADKALLNRIFIKCGAKEFRFIEKSGAYFGFLFGLVQMLVWYNFQDWWFLPAAGMTVGFITNWIALKLIFKPERPIRILNFEIQGLFIKRQKEVSAEYASIISGQILTSPKIFENIFFGPRSGQVTQLIKDQVTRVVDLAAGSSKEIFQFLTGVQQYKVIKNLAYSAFVEDLKIIVSQTFNYAEQALDIEHTLRSRMQALPPTKFAGFLHPIFQEDEWKLITVGAILGGLAGVIQLYLFF